MRASSSTTRIRREGIFRSDREEFRTGLAPAGGLPPRAVVDCASIEKPQTVDSRYGPRGPILNRATISAALLALAIFVVDLSTPLGVDIGVLYVVPLLVGTLSGPPRFLFIAAAVASVMTIAGALVSGEAAAPAVAIVNRFIALGVIWTTAAVLARFRRTWLDLQART